MSKFFWQMFFGTILFVSVLVSVLLFVHSSNSYKAIRTLRDDHKKLLEKAKMMDETTSSPLLDTSTVEGVTTRLEWKLSVEQVGSVIKRHENYAHSVSIVAFSFNAVVGFSLLALCLVQVCCKDPVQNGQNRRPRPFRFVRAVWSRLRSNSDADDDRIEHVLRVEALPQVGAPVPLPDSVVYRRTRDSEHVVIQELPAQPGLPPSLNDEEE